MDNNENNFSASPEDSSAEPINEADTVLVAESEAEAENQTDKEAEIAPELTPEPEKKQSLAADIYDWLEIFAVSIAAVFVVFAFIARIAVVDGTSMTNTLQHGDKLIVSELFYTPKQGDIIVCQSEFFGFNQPLVKRIIATEGQTISIDTETWTVTVDGTPLEEDYVRYIQGQNMRGWDYGESYTVPEGHVFVMGDNRNDSWDSRDSQVGPIDNRYIIGKVLLRILPLSEFGTID